MINDTGISHITIEGEQIPLYFGMYSLKLWADCLTDDKNTDMVEGGDFSSVGLGVMIYCGYKNHCATERIPEKYSVSHFVRHIDFTLIDEKAQTDMQKVLRDWLYSRYSQKFLRNLNNQKEEVKPEPKKKGRKKKETNEDLKKNS